MHVERFRERLSQLAGETPPPDKFPKRGLQAVCDIMLASDNEDPINERTVRVTMRKLHLSRDHLPFVMRQLGQEPQFPIGIDKDDLCRKYSLHESSFKLKYPGKNMMSTGFVAKKMLGMDSAISTIGPKRAMCERLWAGLNMPVSKL